VSGTRSRPARSASKPSGPQSRPRSRARPLTIRRPIIWRPQSRSAPTATPPPGPDGRLRRHWPAVPGHARQAARRSSPERTAPAIASSRNARTGKARQPGLPGLPGTPRRPRARTDHTSHSSPATCRSVAGSRPPQLHHIDCSPRQSGLPASAAHAATGHYRPAQSWPAAPVPSSRLGDAALRRPTRPAPGPDVPRGYHPRVPSLIQSGRSPARYRPGPPTRTGVIIAACEGSLSAHLRCINLQAEQPHIELNWPGRRRGQHYQET
jgi:hypothetical protein